MFQPPSATGAQIDLRAKSRLPQDADLKEYRHHHRIPAPFDGLKPGFERFKNSRIRISFRRHCCNDIDQTGRRGHPIETFPQGEKWFFDIDMPNAIQRIVWLFEERQAGQDERLETAPELAFLSAGAAGHPSDFTQLKGEERDDPVRLTPLLTFERDGKGVNKRHGVRHKPPTMEQDGRT